MSLTVCGFSKMEESAVLEKETEDEVCEAVIAAMINALPENLQTMEVFEHILSQSYQMLFARPIKLCE